MSGPFCVSPSALRSAAGSVRGVRASVLCLDVAGTFAHAGSGLPSTHTQSAAQSLGHHVLAALTVWQDDLESFAGNLTISADGYAQTDHVQACAIAKAGERPR